MPSSLLHNTDCVVPSGSNDNSMQVEHSRMHEEKIVSVHLLHVILPGGGVQDLK